MGGATAGSPCSQKVYWQKTKLERLRGRPVASLIRTCSQKETRQDVTVAPPSFMLVHLQENKKGDNSTLQVSLLAMCTISPLVSITS